MRRRPTERHCHANELDTASLQVAPSTHTSLPSAAASFPSPPPPSPFRCCSLIVYPLVCLAIKFFLFVLCYFFFGFSTRGDSVSDLPKQ